MQQDLPDSWTWTGDTATNFWVPASPTGLWMWLLICLLVLALACLVVIVLIDQCQTLTISVREGGFETVVYRPLASLSPREIVGLLSSTGATQWAESPLISSDQLRDLLTSECRAQVADKPGF
jgi:hypothetical protein